MNVHRETNDDPRYERAAANAVVRGIEVERNEYGCYVSVHTCPTCGHRFTVCPPDATFGRNCLGEACASYDPALDADVFFLPDDPSLIDGTS